jgi:nitroreductase
MIKIKKRSLLLILSFSLIIHNLFNLNSIANPLPVDIPSLGNIFPKENTVCSMTNASVVVDIDATNLLNNISFSFEGNYTIYNPGDTINLTIGAPFSRMSIRPDSICRVKINDSLIPYIIIEPPSTNEWFNATYWFRYIWANYFDLMFLLCNVTIPKNTSIILEYTFDTNLTSNINNLHELTINYYVGSSRAWEGVINEAVEFKVYGKTPDEFYNRSCTVSDLLGGKRYLWQWENERIYDNSVYIIYYGNYSYNWGLFFVPITFRKNIYCNIYQFTNMDLINNDIVEFIKERKSIRSFIYQKIPKETILSWLDCGRWAPSGRNSQPWRVCVVSHPTVKRMISELTKYGGIIEEAYASLVVFLDLERGYDRTKDYQAIGAFMQNILLAIHANEDLGAVWIGEILNKKEEVNEIFKFPLDKFELMGVIAVGYIDNARVKASKAQRERRNVDEFVDWY